MWRVWDLRMQKMGTWPRPPGEAWAASDMQRGPRRTVGTQACPINKDVWQRFICTATDLACSLNPFTGSWPSWVTSDAEALSRHVHRSHALPQPVLFLSLFTSRLHRHSTSCTPLNLLGLWPSELFPMKNEECRSSTTEWMRIGAFAVPASALGINYLHFFHHKLSPFLTTTFN